MTFAYVKRIEKFIIFDKHVQIFQFFFQYVL